MPVNDPGRSPASRPKRPRRFGGPGRRRAITISIGVAALPESAESVAGLVAAADQALYRAKQGGRNRVEVAAP